jgi:hypothetical protein
MTAPHEEIRHGHGEVRSEEDRIASGAIIGVGVASLVVFLLAGWAASAYFWARFTDHPQPPPPSEVGRSKIGMVEQQLFERARRGERDRAARLERLRSFGWVDREAGIAHIPIDRAMDLVSKGVRPATGGGQEERRVPGGQP